ncbi:MAG: class A beta-lactamase-related serine hydrolase, partial [Odoribacter sp.]|nr:class A beta-lactamase-related serine hydrolase [Odoribacter sp.]
MIQNPIFRHLLHGLVAAFLFFSGAKAQGNVVETELIRYVRSCPAEIGVAVLTDTKDTICINNEVPYPMNSVMKLYQAMAVAAVLQAQGRSLDSLLLIKQEELHPQTYSPMREAYPSGDFQLSIADLLKYSLQPSDNNACDILYDRVVGMEATEKYIQNLGIKNFAIRVNERDMYEDNVASYENWNHPLSAALLIDKLFTQPLYEPVYQNFLTETLISCHTGQNRLAKPLLPQGAVIGHKTGTGFPSPNGLPQGINDVGFVRLPNGRHYA